MADEHDGHVPLPDGLYGSRDDLPGRVVTAHGVEGHGQRTSGGLHGRIVGRQRRVPR